MPDRTGIEWTDATWNPLSGCSIVSPGCTNCYAMKLAHRYTGTALYKGLTHSVNGHAVWTGKIALNERMLNAPLGWQKPRRIFVNSMSDLFHEAVANETIDRIFDVMGRAGRHVFQVLTKRADRLEAYMAARTGEVLPNLWLGVSVEDQARADERIPPLMRTRAAIRFLSCEPLLEGIDIASCLAKDCGPDWVIAGGESGSEARPPHPAWIRSLREQCQATGTQFFFKQWGEWGPAEHGVPGKLYRSHEPHGVNRYGKRTAGRMLDGRTWDEFPIAWPIDKDG